MRLANINRDRSWLSTPMLLDSLLIRPIGNGAYWASGAPAAMLAMLQPGSICAVCLEESIPAKRI